MKKLFLINCLLTILIQPAIAQYKGQKFIITVANSCFFDLFAEGHPEEGEGIFYPYTSLIKKDKSFTYECKNDNAFRGVEGHLKFRAYNNEVSGGIDIYFDNPAVGSMKYTISAEWPFKVKHVVPAAEKRYPNLWIDISVDTATHGPVDQHGLDGTFNNGYSQNLNEPIPTIINFDWQVKQRTRKDEDDEKNGKAYNEVTYFFTTNGDYAAIKPTDKDFSLMIYSKKGNTWIFDDTKKTITVMNMPKTVGEGGKMGKETAEKIKKAPLTKDREDEYTITKTGKTKNLFGYTTEEYELKSKKIISSGMASKTGTVSFWYARVPFDPVKIYTMGVGRPADLTKMQNDPMLKNNITAIPVLNKNYLWVETEAGGIKGMETLEIKKVNNTVTTAGYKIKVMNSLKDMLKADIDN